MIFDYILYINDNKITANTSYFMLQNILITLQQSVRIILKNILACPMVINFNIALNVIAIFRLFQNTVIK